MKLTRRQIAWSFLGVATAFLIIVTISATIFAAFMSTRIRITQQNNTETLKNSAQTLDIIQDCTQEGGKCYQRNQAATAEAVGNITHVIVLASACSVGLDAKGLTVKERESTIQTCVLEALGEKP